MSKRKLLLADDSETVQKVVNLTFELEGIEVITFGDGDSAMEQMTAIAPDVVLADVNMPGLSGYDICKRIKETEAIKRIPVILLVGSFEPFDEERALQVGADDFLTKPFQSIRQLVTKVNDLLTVKKDGVSENDDFNETLNFEENSNQEPDFGDPGMDDEMIQTSQIGSVPIDETAKYQSPVNSDEETDYSKTQPLSANDLQDIYATGYNSETSEQTVYELADESAETQAETFEDQNTAVEMSDDEYQSEEFSVESETETEENLTRENSGNADMQESTAQFGEIEADEDSGRQPDDIDYFYREPDYEEAETVDVQDYSEESEPIEMDSEEVSEPFVNEQEPETNLSQADSDLSFEDDNPQIDQNFSETENQPESPEMLETENEKSQFADSAPILNFDEFDLLEIPFTESPATYSTEAVSEPEIPAVEESVHEEPAAAEEVKNEVAQQLSGVNLSAADIDAIADKVVEKLTARLKE